MEWSNNFRVCVCVGWRQAGEWAALLSRPFRSQLEMLPQCSACRAIQQPSAEGSRRQDAGQAWPRGNQLGSSVTQAKPCQIKLCSHLVALFIYISRDGTNYRKPLLSAFVSSHVSFPQSSGKYPPKNVLHIKATSGIVSLLLSLFFLLECACRAQTDLCKISKQAPNRAKGSQA